MDYTGNDTLIIFKGEVFYCHLPEMVTKKKKKKTLKPTWLRHDSGSGEKPREMHSMPPASHTDFPQGVKAIYIKSCFETEGT